MKQLFDFDIDKILVVDDDRDVVQAICSVLDDNFPGVISVTAFDGNEAIDQFERHFPAVIILDIMLPKRSGFLVMERISKITNKGKDIKKPPIIIVITGDLGPRNKVFGESLGVWQYIFKPFRMERLCDYVRKALAILMVDSEKQEKKLC